MFVGTTDSLATKKDNEWTYSKIKADVVQFKEFSSGHLTFMVGKDMSYFTNDVMSLLTKYQPLNNSSE
jgi:hypothetical protein